MEILIVVIILMKTDAEQEWNALLVTSNAMTARVLIKLMFATALLIVRMVPMKTLMERVLQERRVEKMVIRVSTYVLLQLMVIIVPVKRATKWGLTGVRVSILTNAFLVNKYVLKSARILCQDFNVFVPKVIE
jgi:hypothetical protein